MRSKRAPKVRVGNVPLGQKSLDLRCEEKDGAKKFGAIAKQLKLPGCMVSQTSVVITITAVVCIWRVKILVSACGNALKRSRSRNCSLLTWVFALPDIPRPMAWKLCIVWLKTNLKKLTFAMSRVTIFQIWDSSKIEICGWNFNRNETSCLSIAVYYTT